MWCGSGGRLSTALRVRLRAANYGFLWVEVFRGTLRSTGAVLAVCGLSTKPKRRKRVVFLRVVHSHVTENLPEKFWHLIFDPELPFPGARQATSYFLGGDVHVRELLFRQCLSPS